MPQDKRQPPSPALPPIDTSSLALMSREEKLAFLEALEERGRRDKLKLGRYKPNNGQLVVHRSQAKTRLVISGNGAGKTTMAVHEAVWAAQGYSPVTGQYTEVPRKVVILLDKPDKVESKWLPEIRKWFPTDNWGFHKHGKPYIVECSLPNGSQLMFFFHDQDLLTFESFELDDLIADEPPPRNVYIALLRGMRNKHANARVLIIGTPITGAWLRKEIYEPWAEGELPDTECFKFHTNVNDANLPPGYVQWFSSKLSEKERRIRLDGDFFDLDGLALAHLIDKSKHYLEKGSYEFNMGSPCVVAIDCHPAKRHVAVLIGADKTGPVVLKELALKATPREFARELKKWYQGYRVIDLVCDSLGSSDMTGGEGFLSFIQVLNDEGVRVRPTTYKDKSDEDWINRIQDVLAVPDQPDNFGQQLPKLRFMSSCTGCINDVETVEWAKFKNMDEFKPTLDISRKDYLACIKYGLASNISLGKAKDKVYYRKEAAYGIQPRHKSAISRMRLKSR